MNVTVGGNTVSIQVQSSGLGAALALNRTAAADAASAIAAADAAAASQSASAASEDAAAASAAAAATTLAGAALKASNLSDVANTSTALSNLTLLPVGTGAVARSVTQVLNDYTNSVMGFGATGDGTTNDTVAVQAAFAAYGNRPIFFPPNKTYRLGAVGGLGAAGGGIQSVAGYDTIIKPIGGFTGSIFYNQNAGTSSSGYGYIHDIRFDLNSENCIAIDLSHCDTWVVERVNGRGGPNKAGAVGTLFKFGAPTDSSSYNNVIRDCGAEYFAKAVIFGLNANQNRVEGGTFTNNDIAFDCAPGGVLVRPQLLGVRVEGNNIGVKEGAQGGVYLGYFEDHSTGDFSFTTDSADCVILPGTTTATTVTTLHNYLNAANLRSLSDDMGYFDFQDSASRIRRERGLTIRRGSGQTGAVTVPPGYNLTDIHADPLFIANASGTTPAAGLYASNAAGTEAVQVLTVDNADRINLPGYSYGLAAYTRIYVGPNFNFNPNVGLEWAGVKVLGARDTGWTAATGTGSKGAFAATAAGTANAAYVQADFQAALNRIAALEARVKSYDDALVAHGLIGT